MPTQQIEPVTQAEEPFDLEDFRRMVYGATTREGADTIRKAVAEIERLRTTTTNTQDDLMGALRRLSGVIHVGSEIYNSDAAINARSIICIASKYGVDTYRAEAYKQR